MESDEPTGPTITVTPAHYVAAAAVKRTESLPEFDAVGNPKPGTEKSVNVSEAALPARDVFEWTVIVDGDDGSHTMGGTEDTESAAQGAAEAAAATLAG